MNKQFCGNCGSEIEPGTSFCPSCGTRVQQEVQPVQPVQQVYQQPLPAKKPIDKKAVFGIAGGVAVLALIIVLICVFSGSGSAGDVLKNYRYRDITGRYEGEVTVKQIKAGGDYAEIAEFVGLYDKAELKAMENTKLDASITLDDDSLSIRTGALFLSTSSLTINDLEFVKGHAEGKLVDEDDDGNKMTITYDLTLHEGSQKDTDYRIYGTIQVSYTVKMLKAKCTYSCKILVDCEQ